MKARQFLPTVCLVSLVAAGEPAQDTPAESVRTLLEEAVPAASSKVERETLLRCLPPESVLVFCAHDLDSIRTDAADNAWFQFLEDEQVSPLVDSFFEELAEELESGENAEDEADLDPLEVLDSIHGSILVFLAPVGADLEPGFGLIVDPGTDRAAFDEVYERLLDGLEAESVASMDAYEDIELTVFEALPEESVEDSPVDTVMSFEADGLVALVGSQGVASTLELAQGLVDRRRGTDDSLGMADSEWLAGARAASGPLQPIELFLDLGRILDITVEMDELDEESTEVMNMLGLFDMRWIYASAGLGAGETLDLKFNIHLPESGELHRMLALLGPLPMALGELMPSESSSIGLFNFDLWGLYETVMSVIEDNYPEEYPEMRQQIDGMAQMTGLDFEQDFLAQFTGDFGSFSMQVPEDESMMDMSGMFLGGGMPMDTAMGGATIIGLKDVEVVVGFLDQVLAMGGMDAMVESEDFQGRTLHHMAPPDGPVGVWWSFLDDSCVVSFYPTAVRSALRNVGAEDAPNALDNESFSAALGPLTRAPMVSLTDTRTYVRTLLGLGSMFEGMIEEGLMDVEEGDSFDFTAPDPALADEYFEGTMLFTVERGSESIGFRFSAF